MSNPRHTHQPLGPLTARELVRDDILRELARHTPDRDRGELSPEHLAICASYLTEIAAELLIWRLADDTGPLMVCRQTTAGQRALPSEGR